MSRWLKRGLGILVLIGLMIVVTVSWYYQKEIARPLVLPEQDFVVERGDTLSSIAGNLVNNDVLPESYTIRIFARLNKIHHIKAGEYRFPEKVNLAEFVRRLESGKGQVGIKITILEGWTFRQMREALSKALKMEQKTAHWSDQKIMSELGVPDLHPEGQFYPDTYHYHSGDSDLTVFKKSFNLMQEILEDAWANRKPDIQIDNKYQALIMASIIEKESQVWDEQPEISGVFDNRLRIGMRLQTDPTVIYGVGEAYNGNITRKHLKTDTPYNTYTRYGLPPTPISLPGELAIKAAVNPV